MIWVLTRPFQRVKVSTIQREGARRMKLYADSKFFGFSNGWWFSREFVVPGME